MKRGDIRISVEDDGFRVIKETKVLSSTNWAAVKNVTAYKRDAFATDLICVAIRDGEHTIEVNEEMEGWRQLLEILPMKLHGFPLRGAWEMKVALPPFATNVTTLWSHK